MRSCVIYENRKILQYNAIAYSTSLINPLSNLCEVSNILKCNHINSGHILFDLLLSNGENFNRFVAGYYNGIELERESLEIIQISDIEILKVINLFYKGNSDYFKNSALTTSQKCRYFLGRL